MLAMTRSLFENILENFRDFNKYLKNSLRLKKYKVF